MELAKTTTQTIRDKKIRNKNWIMENLLIKRIEGKNKRRMPISQMTILKKL